MYKLEKEYIDYNIEFLHSYVDKSGNLDKIDYDGTVMRSWALEGCFITEMNMPSEANNYFTCTLNMDVCVEL